MKRLIALVVAVVLSWLATPVMASTHLVPVGTVLAYTYDGQHSSAPAARDASQRRFPVDSSTAYPYDNVGRWPDSASARSAWASSPPTRSTTLRSLSGQPRFRGVRHARWDLARSARSDVAAKATPQVLKGPIADAVPKNLAQQLALGAAKDGQGTIIMRNLTTKMDVEFKFP
ncbi:MAG: hypothetical protein J7518_10095 [Nocardioidaceae bacterium]|nr:hypothetical protein [Nocardioidaceae bacterium]